MKDRFQYSQTTLGVTVGVLVTYIGHHIQSQEKCYVWAYTVNIANNSGKTVKLERRYWKIIDKKGIISEVDGEGIVGEQPVLENGEIFEYTSGAYIHSDSGIMKGHYIFSDLKSNEVLRVKIPPFSLDIPKEDDENNIIY